MIGEQTGIGKKTYIMLLLCFDVYLMFNLFIDSHKKSSKINIAIMSTVSSVIFLWNPQELFRACSMSFTDMVPFYNEGGIVHVKRLAE